MLTPSQNQALYPVLQHYTGSKIVSISYIGDGLIFSNSWGVSGLLVENKEGDWDIIIGEELVDRIEKDVFEALVKPTAKSNIEEYIKILDHLSTDENVSYRSKVLVSQILGILEEFILNSSFIPKKEIKFGPFWIFSYKGNKFINSLN
jgi:hypothetical protein